MTTENQGLVNTMRKQTLPRQSAHIVDLLTILWKNVSKISEKKNIKLVLLVLCLTKIQIVQLGNALDADMKIILWQNVPSHLKIVRKDASQYVLMNKVIVHEATAKMTMTIRYTHLWRECLVMTNVNVKSTVTVLNLPIGFWIQELRAI